MPSPSDFRGHAFAPARIDSSGREIGRRLYWKLYAIENLLRIVVHSVLSQQIGANWWALAVNVKLQDDVKDLKQKYASKPQHGAPGKHDIYYTYLSDLNKIIANHSHLFAPLIPDIDQWVARVEEVRIPRNIVGHMNWPSPDDRRRIDDVYDDLQVLVKQLSHTGSGITFRIP
jgi:hypothetical protein